MIEFIKDLGYGMKAHTGKLWYCYFTILFFIGGLMNKKAPWWIGLTMLVIEIPLFMATSYNIGKRNRKRPK